MGPWIDPYGAPEFFVDGVAYREMVGTEFVRSTFFARDRDELIIKVKLVISVVSISTEQNAMRDFLAHNSLRIAN